MKYLILTISLIFGEKLFAQHNYSFMPNTINVNVVKPLSPVKPVDYGKQFSNLSNSINDVSASRAAKRQELENITYEAQKDIQMYLAIGNSTSINTLLSNIQSKSKENINSYYSLLTNGQIDPDDYPNILSNEVNNYKSFALAISSFNDLFQTRFNVLKNLQQYDIITSLTNSLDNYVSPIFIQSSYDVITKNKRYNAVTNQRIELIRQNKVKTEDFLNTIISILDKYGNETGNNLFSYEILVDQQCSSQFSISLQKGFYKSNETVNFLTLDIPNSHKLLGYNQFERKYFDGSVFKLNINYSPLKYFATTNLSSREFLDSLNNAFKLNLNKPTLGIRMNKNSNEIEQVFFNSPAELEGINLGDKILEIENISFNPKTSFEYGNYGKGIGDTIKMKLQRGLEIFVKNLVLRKNENIISNFNIKLGKDGGVLFLAKEEIEEYGDVKNFLNITCMNAIAEQMIVINYKIELSNSLAQKDAKEAFEEFKPLIKEINDSVKIND